MSKIHVGFRPTRQVSDVLGVQMAPDGRVVRLQSQGYKPRMPSDGSCGCKRKSGHDGTHVLDLCDKHGRERGIAAYCLQPFRETRDPGLTP